jgi:hypothetical protein
MWLTKEDAVEMYARFLVTRHGLAASRVARERAAWFRARGDADGHVIYNQVAEAVAPRSMNFSIPELTKISAMRIRPIARIASLTPAAARTFARTGLPLAVVVVIGSLPLNSHENALHDERFLPKPRYGP